MTVLDTLKERGFLQQLTHETEIAELFAKEKITFYIGFDPTADSLHVGHFLGMMVMAHMQRPVTVQSALLAVERRWWEILPARPICAR